MDEQVYQDGPDFYLERDGKSDLRIAAYPNLVKGDFDLEGAKKARKEFENDFPYEVFHYKLI